MLRTSLALLVAIVIAAPAAAQPSLSATVGPGLTSMTGDDGAERNLNAVAGFEHLMKSERVRIFYDLGTGDYASPGDWRFLAQSAGASYRFDFDGKSTRRLYVGGDGTFRRNGDSWAAADYNALGAFANLELRPGRATVRSGYRLDLRRFPSSPGMDQLQHTGFGSVLVSFETRTTLVAEVMAGAKHYEAVSATTEVMAVPTETPEGLHSPGLGLGRWGGMANATLVPIVTPGAPGSDAQQVTVFGRVAQSLAARTGLTMEVSRRRVFGEVPPALVATPASFFDDGIYDDTFASDATRGAIGVKSIVGGGVELAASIVLLDKDYKATFAFDEEGVPVPGVLRADRVKLAYLDASWPILPSRTGHVSLDLLTGYEYTNHRSTSALYRYTAHAVRVAIGISY